jgi:hypothetical protein
MGIGKNPFVPNPLLGQSVLAVSFLLSLHWGMRLLVTDLKRVDLVAAKIAATQGFVLAIA